jgi:hypothetical protein
MPIISSASHTPQNQNNPSPPSVQPRNEPYVFFSHPTATTPHHGGTNASVPWCRRPDRMMRWQGGWLVGWLVGRLVWWRRWGDLSSVRSRMERARCKQMTPLGGLCPLCHSSVFRLFDSFNSPLTPEEAWGLKLGWPYLSSIHHPTCSFS